jgi:glucose/arabinose dehydrogenase
MDNFPLVCSAVLAGALLFPAAGWSETRIGPAAFGGWQGDAPGVVRLIRPDDLPPPYATRSVGNGSAVVARPQGALPQVPPGFKVSLFAEGLRVPRVLRVAPNGDIFLAESGAGRVRVYRVAEDETTPSEDSIFAAGFSYPYGIAFWPPGPDPEYVYIAQRGRVFRFPYRNGDLTARGKGEVVVDGIPTGGHVTRDIAFSPDGKRLYLAVGSGSNVGQSMGAGPTDLAAFDAATALGAAWGSESGRANVLVYDPQGGAGRIYATGIRNCAGLAIEPQTGAPWCATNERDGLGDNLPPDYVTRVEEGAFYGWPWYYIGDHQDPRHADARPDLAGKVTVPDVLIQPHSAPLGLAFYNADTFPEAYRGDGFATLHGSWNRSESTGFKVVRILMKDGVPTGEYEDFLTGFVIANGEVWGRPVGIAVTHDGALLVSEDGNGTIWRVDYVGG